MPLQSLGGGSAGSAPSKYAHALWDDSFLSYRVDKPRESQTDADDRLTHTTTVGVSTNCTMLRHLPC